MVDTMLNAANIAYGAAPIRLHIVQGSNVVYEGGAGPMGYSMEKVRAWLQSYALKESWDELLWIEEDELFQIHRLGFVNIWILRAC